MQNSILSVGIDLGTSTTQIIFSKIYMQNSSVTAVPAVKITDKKIIYRSKIYFTPLINKNEINLAGAWRVSSAVHHGAGPPRPGRGVQHRVPREDVDVVELPEPYFWQRLRVDSRYRYGHGDRGRPHRSVGGIGSGLRGHDDGAVVPRLQRAVVGRNPARLGRWPVDWSMARLLAF